MDKKVIHEQCIQLLDMIETFKHSIMLVERAKSFHIALENTPMVKRYKKDIKESGDEIKRLELRYNNLIKQLKEVK